MVWDATGQVNLWFQDVMGRSAWLIPITHAGDRIYMLLLIPVVWFLFNRRDGLFLLFATVSTFFVNSFLKLLFHQPRPFWVTQMNVYAYEGSFGFPSGHSQNSVVIWGLLAIILVRHKILKPGIATLLSVVFVFLISISRIIYGAHFLQDILFGWTVGLVLLVVILKLEKPVENFFNSLSGSAQFGLLIFLAVLMYGLAMLATPSQIPDLAKWNAQAQLSVETTALDQVTFKPLSPTGMKSFLTIVGLLFGVAFSMILPSSDFSLSAASDRWLALIGCILWMSILFVGLREVFTSDGHVGYTLHLIQYWLVSFFGSVMFQRLLLSRR